MTIFQQYYTSFRHPTDSRRGGGYGVQAETNGIPASAQGMIDKTVGYRIPRSSPPDATHQHPIALRFQALNGQAILSCVQSSGKDELGRDGNYFAHSLIGSTEEITGSLPPIFYWKSDFWISRDDTHYDTLPSVPSMDDLPLRFDPNKLWDFVRQGNRRAWFHKLLCAVIDYSRSKRSIVILDTNDSIAQWIACMTMALPPSYYPHLSFATYHHDPYTAPFMLIGTTNDSGFRFSTDDYLRYFVLNAEVGKVSDAPASDYADFVAQRFNADQFDAEIVSFFDWQAEYPLAQQGIGTHLDDLINFRQTTFYQTLPPDSQKSVRAASVIINESRGVTLSPQRLGDLRAAFEIMYAAAVSRSEALVDYLQAAQALKTADRDFAQSAPNVALLLAQLVLQKRAEDVTQLTRQSELLYAPEVMTQAARTPQVLDLLAQRLDQRDIQQHALLWKAFDKKLHASLAQMPNVQTILLSTFTALDKVGGSKFPIPDIARDILGAMLNGASMNDFAGLLQLAAHFKERQPSSLALEWLYYLRVENLALKSRSEQQYWQLWDNYPSLYTYELNADLARAGKADNAVTMIANWSGLLSDPTASIITEALNFLWSQPHISQRELAQAMLLHPSLESRIPPDWKQRLVETMLAEAVISSVDERTSELYERFLAASNLNLSPALIGAMEGSLALLKKSLTQSNVVNIQRRLNDVDEKKYREETTSLMKMFFVTSKNTSEQHLLMLFATYTPKHKQVFWELYWSKLRTELLDEKHVEPVAIILDLWFKFVGQLEARFPLITPEFFLELPEVLTSVREAKGFNQIERDLERTVSRYAWHTLVSKYLAKSRRGLRLF